MKNDATLVQRLQRENRELRAEIRKPKKDPGAERVYQELLGARTKLREAEKRLEPLERDAEERAAIQQVVMDVDVPKWAVERPAPGGTPGVPSVLATDWHTGETINERLIGGVNRYNRKIQEERVRLFAGNAIELLTEHTKNPRYPGLVFAIGGDMVSGDIHEELTASNWCEVRDAIRLTIEWLAWSIEQLAERVTPNILVVAVTGNHGRLTKKMTFKRRTGTSADAMIYDGLAAHFRRDRSITIAVAEGVSLRYKVFNHRNLLLHGDRDSIGQKGGDGIIGAIGPIVRGKKALLARNSQIDQEFDTLIMGHWHRRLPLPGLIVGQALKGYDEYAWGCGFEYQEPTQEMWFTHPERGVTSHHPIFLTPKAAKRPRETWASVDTRGVSLREEAAA